MIIHSLDGIAHSYVDELSPSEREFLMQTQTELTRLRNQIAEIHTLVECAAPQCKRGVAVGGMCVEHAERELERLRGIEAAVTSISLIPGITLVGDGIIAMWELIAHDAPPTYAPVFRAIRDALEAK